MTVLPHPATIPTQHRQTHPGEIHHTLTGRQLDEICDAAGLSAWSGGRGDHPIEVSEAPLWTLDRCGRVLGTARCLAVAGLTNVELRHLLSALHAVAPAITRDLDDHDLIWSEMVQGIGQVTYLLGIEVVR